MSYVVLARKWRPRTLSDLTGQDHVARTLTHAIERDRVPHALLLTGARGVGKTSTARIVAMALNCQLGPTPSPCGKCPSCEEVQRSQSVDVLEIDGASNRGINEIRELRDGVRYSPNRDRYKIYIIDEVHMLTTEAFNALLKTLEEPPPHVIFIFATTEAQKIPVTILSRCQRFDFRRIPHAAIVGRLEHIAREEGLSIAPEVLSTIARQAQGGMRDALSLFDQVLAFAEGQISLETAAEILGVADRRRLFALGDAIVRRDLGAALSLLDEVAGYGIDMPHFAGELLAHLRDLTVVAAAPGRSELIELTDAELRSARETVARSEPSTLHRLFEIMATGAEEISRSSYPKLVFEMTLVRLASVEPLYPIESLIARLEAIAGGRKLPLPSPAGATPAPAAPTGAPPAQAAPASASPERAATASASPAHEAPPSAAPPHAIARGAPPLPAATASATAPAAPSQSAPALTAVPFVPTSPASATRMPPEDWRALIASLDADKDPAGRLLAHAAMLAAPGVVVIAVGDEWIGAFGSDLPARLAERSRTLFGHEMTFRVEAESRLSPERLATAHRVASEEARAEAERVAEARAYMLSHPSVTTVLARWPDARATVRVDDAL